MNTIQNITFSYGEQPIFVDAQFELIPNSFMVIAGESGCGKTTLLKILSKDLSCNFQTLDNCIFSLDKELIKYYLSSHLLNNFYFDNMKVSENIEMMKQSYSSSISLDKYIQKIHFENKLQQYPSSLSGGEKQLLSILMQILENKPILILDEPTSSLSMDMKEIVLDVLKECVNDGFTVLVASNDEFIISQAQYLYSICNQSIVYNHHDMIHHDMSSNGFKKVDNLKVQNLQKKHNTFLKWITLCVFIVTLCIGYFFSAQFSNGSSKFEIMQETIKLVDLSNKDILILYYATDNDKHVFFSSSKSMEPELLEELPLIDGIRNAYPYYFMPINATGYDAMNTIQFDGEYELEIDNQTVDLNTLINPTVQFYFEEQELGDGILISEQFVSQLNNSLTYPITLSTDILCPIKTEDSQVLFGEDLIPFDSTTRLYKKDNLTFTVSGTHHYVNVFSRLIQPVLLIPYSQINEYIDCSQVGFCGILVFFDTQKDVDELKEQINKINEDIIIRYPAEENMELYKSYSKTKSDVVKEAFIYTFIYAFLFAAYFIGVEFFFKKKDGSLFIDLEQTSHLYILSRMKSLIVWYLFIVIEVIVLAFKNTLPSSISFYIIFTSLFIALSASLIWAGYKLIYGRHKN